MSFAVNDIVTNVKREFLRKTAADTFYDAMCLQWLNRIFHDIWFDSRWGFRNDADRTIPMVVGQQEYSLDATIGEIFEARMVISGKRVLLVDVADLIRAGFTLAETAAEPDYFWISGYDASTHKIKIKVLPIPTSTLVMSFPNSRVITNLTAGADVPLPNDFQQVFEIGTCVSAAFEHGDPEYSKYLFGLYTQLLRKLKGQYDYPTNDDRQRAIQDVRGATGRGPRPPSNYVVAP